MYSDIIVDEDLMIKSTIMVENIGFQVKSLRSLDTLTAKVKYK